MISHWYNCISSYAMEQLLVNLHFMHNYLKYNGQNITNYFFIIVTSDFFQLFHINLNQYSSNDEK